MLIQTISVNPMVNLWQSTKKKSLCLLSIYSKKKTTGLNYLSSRLGMFRQTHFSTTTYPLVN